MSHPRHDDAHRLARRAKSAAPAMARATTAQKNGVLVRVAKALRDDVDVIQAANAKDIAAAKAAGLSDALTDRLVLSPTRVNALADAVLEIAALKDPVGTIEDLAPRPSGIVVGRMRVPLGTVLMIYESRPNVTVDAGVLALKAGNAVILRGGKEARETNAALHAMVVAALVAEGLPEDAAVFVDDTDRELLYAILQQAGQIDLAIPRGGTSLIEAVKTHARIPVIEHYQGICHVFVDGAACLDVATRIAVNAKVSRPGVCNAMETLLVDKQVASTFIPDVVAKFIHHGVEIRGCADTVRFASPHVVKPAVDDDFHTEFLALVVAIKVVDGFDDALTFIQDHGSNHTASIVTKDHDRAMRFLREVDASCVLVNASTRFNDGGELGLGAELGISTTKLHAYGPMGLTELTTRKYIVLGHGETRGAP